MARTFELTTEGDVTVLKTITVNDALFLPAGWSNISRQDLLCDERGNIVRESCLIRGPSLQVSGMQNVSTPDVTRINDAAVRSAPRLNGNYLFLGDVAAGHFGHAITEGLARFWAVRIFDPDSVRIPIGFNPFGLSRMFHVFRGRDGSRYVHAAINSFGLSRKNFLFTRTPVRLEKVVIPEPSVILRQHFHPEHLETTRRVSKYIFPTQDDNKSDIPIYLSKTRLKRFVGKVKNEMAIEQFMARNFGAKIVYPELLSPKATIKLFNDHKVFVGTAGSAFHSFLFRQVNEKVTAVYLTVVGGLYRNFLEIDHMVGIDGHYIACCSPTRMPREFECDIEVAKAGISSVLNSGSEVAEALVDRADHIPLVDRTT